MIEFVYGRDEEVARFVTGLIPKMRGFGPNIKAIGIVDANGSPLAGVVYHDWNPEAGVISMSAAARDASWLTRPVLQRIFDYPFDECDCQMLMMWVRVNNERLLRQLAVGGFAFVKVPRMFGRDEDAVLATLTEEDWRACQFNRKEAA